VEESLLSAIAMFGVAVDVTVAELHIEPFFPADAAAARAAVWIAMRAAVVAGFATLQFRAFASGERLVEGGRTTTRP
jgi:hypothetical protein